MYSLGYKIFFTYIKTSKHSSGKYYKDNKERLQKKLVKDIKVFLNKKKKKLQYGPGRYKNLPVDEKQKLMECRKNITK